MLFINRKQKGNSIITTPIIIAIGMILISILIVTSIKIITPYIIYEKLSSTCIKYVFVMEEYGYLTKTEENLLMSELKKQGFKEENLRINCTSKKVNYGDEIYLKIDYKYEFDLPLAGKLEIPMEIEKYSICKR